MMNSLSIENFLCRSTPILDVRSPAEYSKGHIPGAISFPLFSDEERAEIGTLYKKEGKKTAVIKGLEIVAPKMTKFIADAEKLSSEELRIHCWRGGMRSESMAWLFEKYGFRTHLLKGGYKQYRNYLLDFFEKPLKLIVLTGFTGSGKTDILNSLKEKGKQTIDLEKLANHKGSSFGNQLSKWQPTTEQFQNDLLQEFLSLDTNKEIFIEDEALMIGKVNIPEDLYMQKNKAVHYRIHTNKALRVEKLTEKYGSCLSEEEMINGTEGIRKKLGHENADNAIEHILSGKLESAVEIILMYYDKYYERAFRMKAPRIGQEFYMSEYSPDEISEKIIASIYGSKVDVV